jgi:uncharacterized membrane protein
MNSRINSIDLTRGVVMLLMALDHVRMYFAHGTWYTNPTDLGTTTPMLFFTRWITHFCAPVFVLLAGTSAFLYGMKNTNKKELSRFLFTRGLWLVFIEWAVVTFAWTFDITYTFIILQVIWAIGISMIVLSLLVLLPNMAIFVIGLVLVFGHNLLDPISVGGNNIHDLLWYTLHQPRFLILDTGRTINFVYPVLPWIGLMALGYILGIFYEQGFDSSARRKWLFTCGTGLILLFLILRGFNLYGEPNLWQPQRSPIFSVMSFLYVTKYPPSLHFLLMTIGPALIFLSMAELKKYQIAKPVITFGRVPLFFYIVHLFTIHLLAILLLAAMGRDWREYILSAQSIRSGRLSDFGLGLEAVYLIWISVIALLYPLCRWYQKFKESNPGKWWLSYL